ncbi:MAG TPA: 30S ribosome-binding factor RbfA [Terriglobia bacterium]|nr:30S ribosome-binding factor RbfA [Terriglobia bacterium]
MAVPGRRQERLADQIRTEVASILTEELKDPRIGFATVTRVELTADLGHARVFVSVLGDEEARRNTLAGLESAAGFLRREITHRLRLRRAPEVVFVLDRGPEDAARIEGLLEKLKHEP